MLKTEYQFTLLSPLHTGGDAKLGTLRLLRRERAILKNPIPIHTRFNPKQDKLKRQAIAYLLLKIWDNIENKNRPTIYNEFSSHIISSTAVASKQEFLNVLCDKLEIRQLTSKPSANFDVFDLLELFEGRDLMQTIQNEHQYIMLIFRKFKDETIDFQKSNPSKSKVSSLSMGLNKESGDIDPIISLESLLKDVQKQDIQEVFLEKVYEDIPTISGNSIRGKLRRIIMYDFCNRMGLNKIHPKIYHRLFTGGTIKGSTEFEDLDRRNQFIKACPMIGLVGSAIGNQTIQGSLDVLIPELICRELGTSNNSYHDYITTTFQTRLDSEKLENNISLMHEVSVKSITDISENLKEYKVLKSEKKGGFYNYLLLTSLDEMSFINLIDGVEAKVEKETHQMKYEFECFAKGSKFSHSFVLNTKDELLTSAYWHAIGLFCERGVLGGKSSVGLGVVDWSELKSLIPEKANQMYLKHLEKEADLIKSYFNN